MRKVIFLLSTFLVITFLVMWFTGAHIIKRQAGVFLAQQNTDSLKINYEDIVVSGFPAKWTLKLKNLKIETIDNSTHNELEFGDAYAHLDLGLKTIDFVFDSDMKLVLAKDTPSSREVRIQTTKLNDLVFKFNRSLLFLIAQGLSEFPTYLKSAYLNTHHFELVEGESIIAQLNDLDLRLRRVSKDKDAATMSINVKGQYKGNEDLFKFRDAKFNTNLDIDIEAVNIDDKKRRIYKAIDIKEFNGQFNQNISIDLVGKVSTGFEQIPTGDLKVKVTNYPDLIDIVLAPNLIVSPDNLKRMISQVAHNEVESIRAQKEQNITRQEQEGDIDNAEKKEVEKPIIIKEPKGEISIEEFDPTKDAHFTINFGAEGLRIGAFDIHDLKQD